MACGATARRQRLKHSRCSATLRSMSPWSERGSPACRRHCICAKKGPLALPSSKRRTSDSAPPAPTSGWATPAPGSRPTNCRPGSATRTPPPGPQATPPGARAAPALPNPRTPPRQWTAHGVAVRLIDAAETARLVGSDVYSGALLDPRTGTIEPLGYVRGLARAAIASGAAVYTQTAVTGARADGALWRLSTARGHSVTARQVVVATNTAQSLAPDAWPQLQQELARLPYFNVATEPLPPASRQKILPGGHGVWDTATILSSWRLHPGGRLVCGSPGAPSPGSFRRSAALPSNTSGTAGSTPRRTTCRTCTGWPAMSGP